MLVLKKWLSKLSASPEAGMGYQIVNIILKNKQEYKNIFVIEGRITEINKNNIIPFTEEEIAEVIITNRKE
jgi:hypothetical protein